MKFILILGLAATAIMGVAVITGAANVPDAKVNAFAGAIAFAEGYWDDNDVVNPNSRPARNNNPGDLEMAGDAGQDGPYAIFSAIDIGWNALYNMVRTDLSGGSHVYSPSDTISVYAQKYTGGDNPGPWASAVAQYIGATPNTKISDWLAS